MACDYVASIESVKFVISVEIPCGFVLKDGLNPPFQKALFIDTHCAALINEQVIETVLIPGTGAGAAQLTCNICVNKTVLVGALHYDMVVGGFERAIDGNPNTGSNTAQITKSQSICLHSIPVAINCEDCPDQCNLLLSNFKFKPTFEDMILYSNNYPDGIAESDDAAEFLAALKAGTPGAGENNANGCKTLVFVGHIDITNETP